MTHPSPTASPTGIAATAKPTVTATELEPPLTEAVASATPEATAALATATEEEDAPEISSANLTLTAIRETVVGLRELAVTHPSPTASPTGIAATAKPTVTATELEPPPTEAVASATPEATAALATATEVEAATRIAPANLTLTTIRATVVGLRELAATRPFPTASPTGIVATVKQQ